MSHDDDFDEADDTVVRVTVPCFLAVTVDIPTTYANTLGDTNGGDDGSNRENLVKLAVDAANEWWGGVKLAPDADVTLAEHDTPFYVGLLDGGDVGAFASLASGWVNNVGPLEAEIERDVVI